MKTPGVNGYQNVNWRKAKRAASWWYSDVPTHANMEMSCYNATAQVWYMISQVLFWYVTGDAECEVKAASENELQCVMQSEEKTHIVTNQGSHHSRLTFQSFCQMSN